MTGAYYRCAGFLQSVFSSPSSSSLPQGRFLILPWGKSWPALSSPFVSLLVVPTLLFLIVCCIERCMCGIWLSLFSGGTWWCTTLLFEYILCWLVVVLMWPLACALIIWSRFVLCKGLVSLLLGQGHIHLVLVLILVVCTFSFAQYLSPVSFSIHCVLRHETF